MMDTKFQNVALGEKGKSKTIGEVFNFKRKPTVENLVEGLVRLRRKSREDLRLKELLKDASSGFKAADFLATPKRVPDEARMLDDWERVKGPVKTLLEELKIDLKSTGTSKAATPTRNEGRRSGSRTAAEIFGSPAAATASAATKMSQSELKSATAKIMTSKI
eukprot:Polyplicarium_translucidae@DN973_c0_g1_i2.p3